MKIILYCTPGTAPMALNAALRYTGVKIGASATDERTEVNGQTFIVRLRRKSETITVFGEES